MAEWERLPEDVIQTQKIKMPKLKTKTTIAEKMARFNLIFTFVWIVLAVPSLLWWKESILWVILISLWANIVGHFSAYLAGRAEIAQETGNNLTKADMAWMDNTFLKREDLIWLKDMMLPAATSTYRPPVGMDSTTTAKP